MRTENIVVRLIGVLMFVVGTFWAWKTLDAPLFTVAGMPVPLPIATAIFGLLVAVIPAPLFRILAVFLPKDQSDKLLEFVDANLAVLKTERLVIRPEDQGEVLADKLNQAIRASRRRSYVVILIIVFGVPSLTYALISANNHEKSSLARESEQLVKGVQGGRLSFSSADNFRQLLEQTPRNKVVDPEKSSSGKIYHILSILYAPTVEDEDAFQSALSSVYAKEVTEVLKRNDYDAKKINAPTSDTEPKDARETLYLLLASICNIKAENGKFLEPLLFGRSILNLVEIKPNVYYHVSGWNYGGLVKTTAAQKLDTNPRLAAAVFPDTIPSRLALATRALSEYRRYKDVDASQLAALRYANNFVDIHLPIIYMLRIREEAFQPENREELEVLKIRTADVATLFQELHVQLDKTQSLRTDPIIFATRAQLFSLEGEVNAKAQTAKSRDAAWCKAQRRKALDAARAGCGAQTRETFSFDNRELVYLSWLWSDQDSKREMETLCSQNL